jgi:hypothetical protein
MVDPGGNSKPARAYVVSALGLVEGPTRGAGVGALRALQGSQAPTQVRHRWVERTAVDVAAACAAGPNPQWNGLYSEAGVPGAVAGTWRHGAGRWRARRAGARCAANEAPARRNPAVRGGLQQAQRSPLSGPTSPRKSAGMVSALSTAGQGGSWCCAPPASDRLPSASLTAVASPCCQCWSSTT